ncbi:MAG: vWA domain-containing protein [Pirellulaceae bacterium]
MIWPTTRLNVDMLGPRSSKWRDRPVCRAYQYQEKDALLQLHCIHCRETFTITSEQLGGRGRCPHCHGEITLPDPENLDEAAAPETSHFAWWENSVSTLVSLVLHAALLLVLALWTYGGSGLAGEGEEVLIGEMPKAALDDTVEDELEADTTAENTDESSLDELMEVEPLDMSDLTSNVDLAAAAPIAGGGGPTMEFDVAITGVGGAGGDWEGMIQSLRRNGLDIVIAFDSTGSMGGEIQQVKGQIERIGQALVKMVPKARISLCTYRDRGDEYLVRGIPLTNDVQQVVSFLDGVKANDGGDTPEAVQAGLRWAIDNNQFRSRARKVILVFGDAPPHAEDLQECLAIASDFARKYQGIVSTVTCRSGRRLPEFRDIADAGNGEAFLTADEKQIMTTLMVMVFGSKHRRKVLEAFELMDR